MPNGLNISDTHPGTSSQNDINFCKFFSQSIYFENEKVGTDYVNQSIKGKTMGPLYY